MAEAIPQTITAAAGPSVRAPLAAAVLVSAVTLSVATFELGMADWPSGFVLLLVVPLVALIFCGCALWSATLLLRLRKGGLKFALPFLVCALTLAVLVYAPLHQIALQQNFNWHRKARDRVLFLTTRGLKHYFTGFLRVPPGGDPKKFFEFEDKPPSQLVRYGKDWYFVAN